MDGGTIERIKRMINERDHDYFASRGLTDLLDEAGIEHVVFANWKYRVCT